MSSRERRVTGPRRPVDLIPVHFVHCGQNVRGLVADASREGMKVVTVQPRPTIRVAPDEPTQFTAWTPDGMRPLTGSIRWASTGPHGNTIGVSLQDSVERNGAAIM